VEHSNNTVADRLRTVAVMAVFKRQLKIHLFTTA